jgi:hypothetical protein
MTSRIFQGGEISMADESKDQEKPKRQGGLLRRIAAVLLLLSLAAGWFYLNFRQYEKRVPPPDAKSLQEFAERMPPPVHLTMLNDEGRPTVIWVGEKTSFPAIPSGPSCYQFDESGNLIDWCSDTGEGHRLDRFVALAYRSPTSSLAEVTRALTPRPPAQAVAPVK